jgi:hypothetical protein
VTNLVQVEEERPMALLAVQHTVQDYPAWRAIYDTLDEVEQNWGVTAASVHQMACASNVVLVLRYFATVAQAQGFLTNREIRAAMERAGVEGTPRVEIYV